MMADPVQMAISGAPGHFKDKVVTKEALNDYIDFWAPMLKTEENIKYVRRKIEEDYYQTMEGDLSVMSDDDDHEEWYNPVLGTPFDSTGRNQHYWDCYRDYLLSKGQLGVNAINEIDNVTNQILSKLVDPRNSKDVWAKRGLVMGSVQSGKTGNYTGLIAKAIDAGYKFIIVLSGIHNDLRAQTQLRINDELLGYDMIQMKKASKISPNKRVGVGRLFPKHKGTSIQTLTTSDEKGDFRKGIAETVNPILDGKHTYVLVIKKHTGVMKNLIKWLQNSAFANDNKIRNVPMLLIDDECDQASINTKKDSDTDEDGYELASPTATNERIRTMLNTFAKSAYLGYTATPFANIFIKSNGKHVALGEDLFPKNFIFSLKRPSSYIGPEEFFGLKGDVGVDDALPLQRRAEDAKDVYIPKHKKDLQVTKLPKTLQDAVKAYLLTVAARKVRETSNSHSSMLVHVSRFTNVQNLTYDLLVKLLQKYLQRINVPSESLDDFRKIWEEDFEKTTKKVNTLVKDSTKPKKWGEMEHISWDEIRKTLPKVVPRITVKELNGKSSDILDYKTHQDKYGTKKNWEERGIHTIVVGGNKLSRGLTLEGLTVSYYLRSSNMYDTLMQMGRWFGYRNSYLDLCRIYSTNDIFTNFGHIATAEKDLREQFTTMADKNKTPKEFGLYVLQSPGNLVVTSNGKRRHSTSFSINFGGAGKEITQYSPSQRAHNWGVLTELIQKLDIQGTLLSSPSQTHNLHWKNVPREVITNFFDEYQAHGIQTTRVAAMAQFIRLQDENMLKEWDVVCIKNKKKKPESYEHIAEHKLHAVQRSATDYNSKRLFVKRIGAPVDEMLDLSVKTQEEVRKDFKDSGKNTLTGSFIRTYRDASKGLLLIYVIADHNGKVYPYGGTNDIVPNEYQYYGFLPSFPSEGTFKTTSITANDIYMDEFTG
jgi:hypothetical protein